jgi:hypothetical protein
MGPDHEIRQATTFEEKVKVFNYQFFPLVLDADLSDMENYAYLEEVKIPPRITEDMVSTEIRRASVHRAPGLNGIPNCFLQAIGKPLVLAL